MKTWQAILLLGTLGAGLHFWRLGVPREVIFDEVHFGKFITAYCCTHERFFDIHPPHAKLLLAGGAKLLGYGGNFDFDHIGQEYARISPIPLRLFVSLTGLVLPLVFFACLRLLRISVPVSFFGGLAVIFDNALLLQTRVIALDGLLLLATFGSLAIFLSARSWGQYALAGGLAGLAVGTKFTGLAALVLLGVLIIFNFQFFRHHGGSADWRTILKWFLRGLIILASAFLIYAAGWWLHFALLTQPGSGDAWGVPTGHFWQDTVVLHKQMLSANYNLTATHPDESAWWSWPVMLTSVFYWSGDNGEIIYFLGNPAVWWGSTLLFIWAVLLSRRETWKRGWIPLAGFFIALLPLTRVPRALFLYHYLTPLLFAFMFGLVWLDTLKNKKMIMGIASTAIIVSFILFSPLTYGFHVSPGWWQVIWWLPGWR